MSKNSYKNILNLPSYTELYKELFAFSSKDRLKEIISIPNVKKLFEKFLDFFTENPEKDFPQDKKILNIYEIDDMLKNLISILHTELNISKEKIFWLIENFIKSEKKNEKNFQNLYKLSHINPEYKNNININEKILNFKENFISFYFDEREKCILCARFVIENYFDMNNNINNYEDNEDNFNSNENINVIENIININNFLFKLYKQLISYESNPIANFDQDKIELLNKRNNQIINEQENILIIMIFICNYNKFINKDIFIGLLNYFYKTKFTLFTYLINNGHYNENVINLMNKSILLIIQHFQCNFLVNKINFNENNNNIFNNLVVFQINDENLFLNFFNEQNIMFNKNFSIIIFTILTIYKIKIKFLGYNHNNNITNFINANKNNFNLSIIKDCFNYLNNILFYIEKDMKIISNYFMFTFKNWVNFILKFYYEINENNDNLLITNEKLISLITLILKNKFSRNDFFENDIKYNYPIFILFKNYYNNDIYNNDFMNVCYNLSKFNDQNSNLIYELLIGKRNINNININDSYDDDNNDFIDRNNNIFENIFKKWDEFIFYLEKILNNNNNINFENENFIYSNNNENIIKLFLKFFSLNENNWFIFCSFLNKNNNIYNNEKESKIIINDDEEEKIYSEIFNKIIKSLLLITKIKNFENKILIDEMLNCLKIFFKNNKSNIINIIKKDKFIFDNFNNVILDIFNNDFRNKDFDKTYKILKIFKYFFSYQNLYKLFFDINNYDNFNNNNNNIDGFLIYENFFFYLKECYNNFTNSNIINSVNEINILKILPKIFLNILNFIILPFNNYNFNNNNFNDNKNISNVMNINKFIIDLFNKNEINLLTIIINNLLIKVYRHEKEEFNYINNLKEKLQKKLKFENINNNYNNNNNNYNILIEDKIDKMIYNILLLFKKINTIINYLHINNISNNNNNFFNFDFILNNFKYDSHIPKIISSPILNSSATFEINIICLLLIYLNGENEDEYNNYYKKYKNNFNIDENNINNINNIFYDFIFNNINENNINISNLIFDNIILILNVLNQNKINILNFLFLINKSNYINEIESNKNLCNYISNKIIYILIENNEEFNIKISCLKFLSFCAINQKKFMINILNLLKNKIDKFFENINEFIISFNNNNNIINFEMKKMFIGNLLIFISNIFNEDEYKNFCQIFLFNNFKKFLNILINECLNSFDFNINEDYINIVNNDMNIFINEEFLINIIGINNKIYNTCFDFIVLKQISILFLRLINYTIFINNKNINNNNNLINNDNNNNNNEYYNFKEQLYKYLHFHLIKIFEIYSQFKNNDIFKNNNNNINNDLNNFFSIFNNFKNNINFSFSIYNEPIIFNNNNIFNYGILYGLDFKYDLLLQTPENFDYKKIYYNIFISLFNSQTQCIIANIYLIGYLFSIDINSIENNINFFINNNNNNINFMNNNKISNKNFIKKIYNFDDVNSYKEINFEPFKMLFKEKFENFDSFFLKFYKNNNFLKFDFINSNLNYNYQILFYDFFNYILDYNYYLYKINNKNNNKNNIIQTQNEFLLNHLETLTNQLSKSINSFKEFNQSNLILHQLTLIYNLISFLIRTNFNFKNNENNSIIIINKTLETLLETFKEIPEYHPLITYIFTTILQMNFPSNEKKNMILNQCSILINLIYKQYIKENINEKVLHSFILFLTTLLDINYKIIFDVIIKDKILTFIYTKILELNNNLNNNNNNLNNNNNYNDNYYSGFERKINHILFLYNLKFLSKILYYYYTSENDIKIKYENVYKNINEFFLEIQNRIFNIFYEEKNEYNCNLAVLEEIYLLSECLSVLSNIENNNNNLINNNNNNFMNGNDENLYYQFLFRVCECILYYGIRIFDYRYNINNNNNDNKIKFKPVSIMEKIMNEIGVDNNNINKNAIYDNNNFINKYKKMYFNNNNNIFENFNYNNNINDIIKFNDNNFYSKLLRQNRINNINNIYNEINLFNYKIENLLLNILFNYSNILKQFFLRKKYSLKEYLITIIQNNNFNNNNYNNNNFNDFNVFINNINLIFKFLENFLKKFYSEEFKILNKKNIIFHNNIKTSINSLFFNLIQNENDFYEIFEIINYTYLNVILIAYYLNDIFIYFKNNNFYEYLLKNLEKIKNDFQLNQNKFKMNSDDNYYNNYKDENENVNKRTINVLNKIIHKISKDVLNN